MADKTRCIEVRRGRGLKVDWGSSFSRRESRAAPAVSVQLWGGGAVLEAVSRYGSWWEEFEFDFCLGSAEHSSVVGMLFYPQQATVVLVVGVPSVQLRSTI